MIHLFLSPSPKQIHSKTFPITEILRPFNKNLHKIFLLSCGSRQQPHSRICLLNSSEKRTDGRTDRMTDWILPAMAINKIPAATSSSQSLWRYFFWSEVETIEWPTDHRFVWEQNGTGAAVIGSMSLIGNTNERKDWLFWRSHLKINLYGKYKKKTTRRTDEVKKCPKTTPPKWSHNGMNEESAARCCGF